MGVVIKLNIALLIEVGGGVMGVGWVGGCGY